MGDEKTDNRAPQEFDDRDNPLGSPTQGATAGDHSDGATADMATLDRENAELRAEIARLTHELQAFREDAERFRAIVNHVPVMIAAGDGHRVTLFNRECERRLGYDRDEISVSEDPAALLFADESFRDQVVASVRRADGQFRPYTVRTKDGTLRTQYWATFSLPTGTVITVGYDTTEREIAINALEDSERRYRALLEAVPDLIVRIARDGTYLDYAPGATTGPYLEPHVFLGATVQDVMPEIAEISLAAIERALETGELQTIEYELPARGGARLYEARLGASGENEVVAIIRDITRQRSVEAQLRQSQKMEAVGRLTGGMAHDFNNLLTVILANTDLATRDSADPDSEAAVALREIRGAALRGSSLVRKLLAFSRQELISLRPVELTELVAELLPTLRRLVPATIDIEIENADDLPEIEGDPGAVEQIIINLVNNACDAMPRGGHLRIGFRREHFDPGAAGNPEWGPRGKYVVLRVTDTGVGMNEETRLRVFEPFYTTKSEGEGSGLGMPMVYGLTKQHGGFVIIDSEPGRGTTVNVYLRPAPTPSASRPAVAQAEKPKGGTETVLVAEDDRLIRRALRRVLERYGYTAIVASDGQEALELLKAHRGEIALVISDVVMPRMSGPALYEAARQEPSPPAFIFTSGYTAQDGLSLPSFDKPPPVLRKPWTAPELLRMIRDVLDRAD